MLYFIDFQGFEEFKAKEVAILSADGKYFDLKLFKPPIKFQDLSLKSVEKIKWLQINFHGLNWREGYEACYKLPKMFAFLKSEDSVFVKGDMKVKFLEDLFATNKIRVKVIQDLKKFHCPKLGELRKNIYKNFFQSCYYDHNGLENCAYLNVLLLAHWWQNNKKATSFVL